jgi:hypothetical protein
LPANCCVLPVNGTYFLVLAREYHQLGVLIPN